MTAKRLETVDEIRVRPGKEDQRFRCVPLHRSEGYAVLGYSSGRPWKLGRGISLAAGTRTIGHYFEGAGYVIWRMLQPDGRLSGHLVHLVKDLRLGNRSVEYCDLFLDIWFRPDFAHVLLDEVELEGAYYRGLIGEKDLRWVYSHRDFLLRRFPLLVKNLWEGDFSPQEIGTAERK